MRNGSCYLVSMIEIQPGTRLGVGRQLLSTINVHFYDVGQDGRTTSFCGQDFNSTALEYVNALSKHEFIFSGQIIPVKGNIACAECRELYKQRVAE